MLPPQALRKNNLARFTTLSLTLSQRSQAVREGEGGRVERAWAGFNPF